MAASISRNAIERKLPLLSGKLRVLYQPGRIFGEPKPLRNHWWKFESYPIIFLARRPED
jgi:hypothetical protein